MTDLRVVAARVEVQGNPGRANPSPQDTIHLSLLVIDRGAPPSENPDVPALTPPLLQWDFLPCVPAPTRIGAPICQIPIEPCEGCTARPPGDPLALPVFGFEVPTADVLEPAQAGSVIVQGAICADGPPAPLDAILRFVFGETEVLDPCEDPEREGRFVSVEIPIEDDPANPNLNPEIERVNLDGMPWPPPYDQGVPRFAPRTGCKAALDALTEDERRAHPTAGDSASTLNLFVTPGSFQTYASEGEELIEEIQVSWLADAGGFDSSFSFITDPARSVLTSWSPPSSAPERGLLVRFTFVIRDGRGGTDHVQRGLCILPPAAG